MKKLKKLAIKKVTLLDLDEPTMHGIAGGITVTCPANTCKTCVDTCGGCFTVPPKLTCCGKCNCTA
jgi:hypothetical protein